MLFPTPKERAVELVEPTRFKAKLQEPTVAAGPDLEPARRAASHLQRLLHRRRRHRAAGLRELRRPGRLRTARPAGRFREGRDRHRALRRVVARHQAEGRRRARRGGLHHLFRSARRRLLHGRGVPAGRLAQSRRRAARQRHGHAGLSRRSADAGHRRHRRRQAPRREGRNDHHQDSGAADFLRRRAAAAGGAGAGRWRRRSWRGALPITYHVGPGPGEGPSQGEVELGHQAHLRRHRPNSRLDVSGRMDHSRQSSRRLGERRGGSGLGRQRAAGRSARLRRTAEAGMEAEAHHRLLRLGRRRRGPARARPNGPRSTPPSLQRHAAVYINCDGNGRGYLSMSRVALAREVHQRRGARYQRSGEEDHGVEAQPVARSFRGAATPEARQEIRHACRICASSALGSGSDYTVFSITSASRRSTSASAAKMAAASIIPSTTISTGTRTFPTPISSTAARWRKPSAAPSCGWPAAEVLPYDFSNLADTVSRYVDELQKLWKSTGDRIQERNREIEEGVFSAISDPRRPTAAAAGGRGAAVPEFRAARKWSRRPVEKRGTVRKSARQSHAVRPEPGVSKRKADSDGTRADGSRRACPGVPGSVTSSTRRASIQATA